MNEERMPRIIEGGLQGKRLRIGIVVSKFNSEVTHQLLTTAVDALKEKGVEDGVVDFDPWYEGLSANAEVRGRRYETWVAGSIPEGEWEAIRQAIRREGFVGGGRFKDQIEMLLGRAVDMRAPGRPRILEK